MASTSANAASSSAGRSVRGRPSSGIPSNIATAIAEHQGDDMAKAILALYRSAAQPAMAEAGQTLEKARARPGLSLLATEDHYIGSDDTRRRSSARAGARVKVLEGLGHWWMVESPEHGAAALSEFWDSLDADATSKES